MTDSVPLEDSKLPKHDSTCFLVEPPVLRREITPVTYENGVPMCFDGVGNLVPYKTRRETGWYELCSCQECRTDCNFDQNLRLRVSQRPWSGRTYWVLVTVWVS